MAILDWEFILGELPTLNKDYKLSGYYSLDTGYENTIHAVHTATYSASPKNARVSTWFNGVGGSFVSILGAIFRKQKDKNTYFYCYIAMLLNPYRGYIEVNRFVVGYYIDGTQYQVATEEINREYNNLEYPDKWGFVYFDAFEHGGKMHFYVWLVPKVDNPDPENPPFIVAENLSAISVEIPEELKNGGAVGIIVGNIESEDGGRVLIDYTQIYY